MKKLILLTLCLTILSLTLPSSILAAEWGPFEWGWEGDESDMRTIIVEYGLQETGSRAYSTEGGEHIRFMAIIGLIIRLFLYFMATFFVVLIIYAGGTWMTAGGNEEKVTKARTIITNSVVGIIIVLSAFAITVFVGQAAVGAMYAREFGFSFPGMGGW